MKLQGEAKLKMTYASLWWVFERKHGKIIIKTLWSV